MKKLLAMLNVKFKSFTYLLKNKKKPTHIFFYSEKQDNIGMFTVDYMKEYAETEARFKDKIYSEMRDINLGYLNNWDDCTIVGVGTDDDVEIIYL